MYLGKRCRLSRTDDDVALKITTIVGAGSAEVSRARRDARSALSAHSAVVSLAAP